MKFLQSLIIAFSMYSKIPMPHLTWDKENMRFALVFFPLVGAVCGGAVTGWYYLSASLGVGYVLKNIVYVLVPVVITGGIHLDGFLDTIDALSSYQTTERRLEILKDSNSGAFAIIYGISYMLFYAAVWSEIKNLESVLVLSISYIFSRSLSGFSITSFKCAKNSGLAASFSTMADKKKAGAFLIIEGVLSALCMMIVDIKSGAAAVLAGLLMFIIYRRISYKMFGGITGDLAGFFLQMCEMLMAVGVMLVQLFPCLII